MSEFGKMMILIDVKLVNSNGSFRNLGDIVDDLSSKWERLTLEQQVIISQAFNEAVI
jgi:hypothetical protein